MLIHHRDGSLVLVEPSDLDQDAVPTAWRSHEPALRSIVRWSNDYLTKPHQDLGRTGNVCPFVQASLDQRKFHLAVYSGRPGEPAEAARALLPYRDWFLDQAATDSQLDTILILFPDLAAEEGNRIVDGVQRLVKSEYVKHGLMIGEFHDGPPDKGGIHNPDFRPLRSPIPLLAIRRMVPTDLLFLQEEPDQVAAYLRQFAGQVPGQIRESIASALVAQPHMPANRTRTA